MTDWGRAELAKRRRSYEPSESVSLSLGLNRGSTPARSQSSESRSVLQGKRLSLENQFMAAVSSSTTATNTTSTPTAPAAPSLTSSSATPSQHLRIPASLAEYLGGSSAPTTASSVGRPPLAGKKIEGGEHSRYHARKVDGVVDEEEILLYGKKSAYEQISSFSENKGSVDVSRKENKIAAGQFHPRDSEYSPDSVVVVKKRKTDPSREDEFPEDFEIRLRPEREEATEESMFQRIDRMRKELLEKPTQEHQREQPPKFIVSPLTQTRRQNSTPLSKLPAEHRTSAGYLELQRIAQEEAPAVDESRREIDHLLSEKKKLLKELKSLRMQEHEQLPDFDWRKSAEELEEYKKKISSTTPSFEMSYRPPNNYFSPGQATGRSPPSKRSAKKEPKPHSQAQASSAKRNIFDVEMANSRQGSYLRESYSGSRLRSSSSSPSSDSRVEIERLRMEKLDLLKDIERLRFEEMQLFEANPPTTIQYTEQQETRAVPSPPDYSERSKATERGSTISSSTFQSGRSWNAADYYAKSSNILEGFGTSPFRKRNIRERPQRDQSEYEVNNTLRDLEEKVRNLEMDQRNTSREMTELYDPRKLEGRGYSPERSSSSPLRSFLNTFQSKYHFESLEDSYQRVRSRLTKAESADESGDEDTYAEELEYSEGENSQEDFRAREERWRKEREEEEREIHRLQHQIPHYRNPPALREPKDQQQSGVPSFMTSKPAEPLPNVHHHQSYNHEPEKTATQPQQGPLSAGFERFEKAIAGLDLLASPQGNKNASHGLYNESHSSPHVAEEFDGRNQEVEEDEVTFDVTNSEDRSEAGEEGEGIAIGNKRNEEEL